MCFCLFTIDLSCWTVSGFSRILASGLLLNDALIRFNSRSMDDFFSAMQINSFRFSSNICSVRWSLNNITFPKEIDWCNRNCQGLYYFIPRGRGVAIFIALINIKIIFTGTNHSCTLKIVKWYWMFFLSQTIDIGINWKSVDEMKKNF